MTCNKGGRIFLFILAYRGEKVEKKKIFLIGDDDIFTWCMKVYPDKRGYQVETASTVAEEKEILKQIIPLYVCFDLKLPDSSGLKLLDLMRADYPDVPFLMASCLKKEDYEQESIKCGATLCIGSLHIMP